MAKHNPDLIMCRKQPGIGTLLSWVVRCCSHWPPLREMYGTGDGLMGVGDGKCVICDSYVRPATLVRICDECNFGSFQGKCTICGGPGISDAYYCKECTVQEKDVTPCECVDVCSVMDVPRLSTWDRRGQICFTNARNTVRSLVYGS
jgi:PHD finger-like domain-containing protein 5A